MLAVCSFTMCIMVQVCHGAALIEQMSCEFCIYSCWFVKEILLWSHLFPSLSNERPITSSSLSSPQSVTYWFCFRCPFLEGHPVAAYTLFVVFLSLLSLFLILSLITCFRGWFICKMWPVKLAFLYFIICAIFLSSLTLCNTPLLTQSVLQIFILF